MVAAGTVITIDQTVTVIILSVRADFRWRNWTGLETELVIAAGIAIVNAALGVPDIRIVIIAVRAERAS